MHLIATVAMAVVVGYAVIQGLSGDYKEMMTALIAVVLAFYHIARTIWGLVQLEEYARWCKYTLQCIRGTRPKYWYELFESNSDDDAVNEKEEYTDLDTTLMVNSDILDNEFTGRDNSVSFS